MANSILLLRLESVMQSWGTRSRWDVRDTGMEPTKSGVIGLIGCAMGLGRNDPELERLDAALLFGVRIDRPGIVSTDYHTVTGYHRTAAGDFKHSRGTAKSFSKAQEHGESTIVSQRDYLHDAAFLVALEGEQTLLQKIQASLMDPVWPIYLGRKACVPSHPVVDRLAREYQDLKSALINEPWAVPRSIKERKSLQKMKQLPKLLAWMEHPEGEHERQDAMRLNQLRFYDFRRCIRIDDINTELLPGRII